jgi:hypothetical protein
VAWFVANTTALTILRHNSVLPAFLEDNGLVINRLANEYESPPMSIPSSAGVPDDKHLETNHDRDEQVTAINSLVVSTQGSHRVKTEAEVELKLKPTLSLDLSIGQENTHRQHISWVDDGLVRAKESMGFCKKLSPLMFDIATACRNKYGDRENNKANQLVARRFILDMFKQHNVRNSDIRDNLPVCILVSFMPTNAEIFAKRMESTRAVQEATHLLNRKYRSFYWREGDWIPWFHKPPDRVA